MRHLLAFVLGGRPMNFNGFALSTWRPAVTSLLGRPLRPQLARTRPLVLGPNGVVEGASRVLQINTEGRLRKRWVRRDPASRLSRCTTIECVPGARCRTGPAC